MVIVDDPRTAPTLNWGILGTGGIASHFAASLLAHTGQRLVAVGSRRPQTARAFADLFEIPAAYGSYRELVSDPGVDVIYVASPHSHHFDHAMLAIDAGKHVLVEKAFTQNHAQAIALADAAARAQVFVMEAMWTRFLPHMVELRRLLAEGVIGEIVSVVADHGQWFPFNPEHRLFNPNLAGGALLDLGIYPVSFAVDMLGLPTTVTAAGSLTQTGVDGQETILFGYPGRAQATLMATLWSKTPTEATVNGTEGSIRVQPTFYAPTALSVNRIDGSRMEWSVPGISHGLQFEAAELARRVSEGELSSPIMPLEESVAIMGIMDQIRAQLGVVYPGEVASNPGGHAAAPGAFPASGQVGAAPTDQGGQTGPAALG